MNRVTALLLVSFAINLLSPQPAWAVSITWSAVGNPGNAADPVDGDNFNVGIQNFGAVPYAYNIGTYDVTNNQYVEFLNAKDSSGLNPLGLYNSIMSNAPFGGINFNNLNLPGSKYSVISGDGNHPVNFVTWFDAIRFANWLNNGQGNGNTETGAYILQGGTQTPSNANSIARQAGATVFLPNINEWYKAAFYNPATSSYFKFPTSSNLAPTASGPTATLNSANYDNAVGNLTDIGAYTGTTSPYGAFDMGGNVWQWNEGFINAFLRGQRGGSFQNTLSNLFSGSQGGDLPQFMDPHYGFRLVSIPIPEPSSVVLAALGFAGLAAWGWRPRKR